jgi:hypothetical protein
MDRAAPRALGPLYKDAPSQGGSASVPAIGLHDRLIGTRIAAENAAMFTTQRHDGRVRRHARFLLEQLDDRLVLSAGSVGAAAESVARRSPVTLPANISPALRLLYREYEQHNHSRTAPGGTPLSIGGARVAVRIKADFPPTLETEVSRLQAIGLRVVRTILNEGMAVGTLPIAALPAVAGVPVELKPALPSARR